jgi:hypothetical protein
VANVMAYQRIEVLTGVVARGWWKFGKVA